ncbi:DNA recombination protein RmuC [Patescibacteria group bacterium]|nr:DNA recombination protein RmuC [Patescibacteria group bacterium]
MWLEFIIILVVMVAGFALLFWRLLKSRTDMSQDNALLMLQNQLNEMRNSLETGLGDSSKALQAQFSETHKIVKNVTEELSKVSNTNEKVVGFTDQLKNLEKVLTNSKTRGSLGESNLELILSNILPPQSYEMQYRFKSGEAVDAVVKIKDKILPIDAKFSLSNYQRIIDEIDDKKKAELEKEFKNDLKKRIDETAKYIRPNENTLEFAFMFIPAEGIYYDLLVNEIGAVKVNTRSLLDYAFNDRKVIIVSPTTFAAYLQTVLQGLRALQIEESTKEIRSNVEKLEKHLGAYQSYHEKVGNQLGTVVNTFNASNKEFKKIDKDVLKITGIGNKVELDDVEKPLIE